MTGAGEDGDGGQISGIIQRHAALPHGIPPHDTFRRVFAALDAAAFQQGFINWMQAIRQLTEGEIVPIDGKRLRRSHDGRLGKAAIHMVSIDAIALAALPKF